MLHKSSYQLIVKETVQQSFFKKFWLHRIFVSIAFSETSAARGFHLRSASVLLIFIGVLSGSIWGYNSYQDRLHLEMEKRGEIPDYMKEKISRLEAEKKGQQEQIRMFAQELGVLQARLDRFDAIGEKLFNDGTLGTYLQGDPDLGGKGGPDWTPLKTIPSIAELNEELSVLSDKTDALDSLMNASMKLLATQEIEKSKRPYMWPVAHKRVYISSPFGYRADPFSKERRFHGGTDFAGPTGAPILSAGDGVVVFTGYRYSYGITIEIRHAHGFSSRYAHLHSSAVKNGDVVKAGDFIGELGSTGRSTGPHLHFEILVDDTKVDPYPFVYESKEEAYTHYMASQRVSVK